MNVRVLSLCVLAGCAQATARTEEGFIPSVAGLRLDRMFAIGGELGGLDDAIASGVELAVLDASGAELARAIGDERGRFELAIDKASGDEVIVSRAGDPSSAVAFRVRDPSAAVKEAIGAPLPGGAGSVPNDLIIVGAGDRARGVLVRSGDNAVSVIDLDRGLEGAGCGVRLPALESTGGPLPASPWFAAALDDEGTRVAVTAQGQRHVYVLDLDACAIERVLETAVLVGVDPPIVLPRAVDADGDGASEREITRFLPRAPQPIARIGTKLAVGFTTFLSPRVGDDPPIYMPAVLAVFDLAALDAPPKLHVLGAYDPQELRATGDGRLLVVCSGIVDAVGGRATTTTPGAVAIYDAGEDRIERTYDLGDFAPGTAVMREGALWVGSIVRAVVWRIDVESGEVTDQIALDPASESEVDSVFRIAELENGLLALPSFDTDRLFILDPVTRALSPAPFTRPLATGPGRPVFDGLQIIARRPGRPGVDFVGPDLFALAGLASRITPISTRSLLGP